MSVSQGSRKCRAKVVTDVVDGVCTIVNVKGDHNHPAVLKRRKRESFLPSIKIEDPIALGSSYETEEYMDDDLTV